MSLAETFHTETIHSRWRRSRRHMIMTRLVSLLLFATSGIVMHGTFMTSGNDVITRLEQAQQTASAGVVLRLR